MANNYYNFTDTFTPGLKARSGDIDREYQAIENAFDLLPADSTALTRGATTFAGVSTGTGNAYEVAMPNTRLSNTDGDEVVFIADKTNTGAITLNVDGIGAISVVRADGNALAANDIQAGLIYPVRYDSTNVRFQLLTPSTSYLTNAAASAAAALSSENAAALSESNASTSESNASISETNASGSAAAAEDWAINPEDVLVPASSGGNEVDEYSAYHWAQKAAGSSGIPIPSGAYGMLHVNAANNAWVQNNDFTINAATQQLLLPQLTTPATPALAFGDGDTGIYESADDALRIAIGGTESWQVDGSFMGGSGNGMGLLRRTAATAVIPGHTFKNDIDTGIGSAAADQLSHIAGGVEAVRLSEASGAVVVSNQSNVGLTADIGSVQGSGVITSTYNVYSTVATAGDAATLPSTFPVGTAIYVKNDGANAMDVFPASGDDAGAGVDTAVVVKAGESTAFIATVADSTWSPLIVSSGSPFETPLVILGDIVTATPPSTETITAKHQYWDNDETDLIGEIGFDGSSSLNIRNYMRGGGSGGTIRLQAVSGAGTLRTLVEAVGDGSTTIRGDDGVIIEGANGDDWARFNGGFCALYGDTGSVVYEQIRTENNTINISETRLKTPVNSDSWWNILYFMWQNNTIRGQLAINTSGNMSLGNNVHGGILTLYGETPGGASRNFIQGDPDVRVSVYHPPSNAVVARTLTPATGGLEVDNQLTGVGFERVLTVGDATAYLTADSSATLTNKTFDANGTGNSLSNVDVADLANGTDGELITWDAAGAPATVAVGTSGHVLTSNGAGAAPTFQAADIFSGVTKHKTADTSRTNTTTLADDTHLAGWNLDADSYYKIEGWIHVDFPTTADPDIKLRPQFSQTPQDCWWTFQGANDAGSATDADHAQYTSDIVLNVTVANDWGFFVSGYIRTNATTGGTFDVQWAQNTLDATNATVVKLGSWVTLTKIA